MEILSNNTDESVGNIEFLITDIRSSVKNQNRVNIFVNGKYSFSLDVAQIIDFKVKINQKISSEELEGLKNESEFGKLYQTTLNWVLVRPRSIKETKEYLEKKKIKRQIENHKRELNAIKIKNNPEFRKIQNYRDVDGFCRERAQRIATKKLPEYQRDMLERVLKKLVEKEYINDQKFADYYIENRFLKKGISRRRMQIELARKGISKEIINEVLNKSGRNDEEELKKIIMKKRGKYGNEKLINYLVRQGFDYQMARTAVLENHCEMD